MEAALDATPRPLTDAEARMCGRYLRDDDTFAVLVAADALLEPLRSNSPRLIADRAGACSLAQFILAAEQRAGVMRELADHLDQAATLARVALLGRADYAEVMAEADAIPRPTP